MRVSEDRKRVRAGRRGDVDRVGREQNEKKGGRDRLRGDIEDERQRERRDRVGGDIEDEKQTVRVERGVGEGRERKSGRRGETVK